MKQLLCSVALLSAVGLLSTPTYAKHVKQFSTTKFNYTLPASLAKQCRTKKTCPIIDIRLIKTEQTWLDTLVNEAFTNSKAPNYTNLRNELNEFAKDAVSNYEAGSACTYTYTIKPKSLPDHKQVAQFTAKGFQDYGCTRYPEYDDYVSIDMTTKKRLTAQALIVKGQDKRFMQVLRTHYHQMLNEIQDDGMSSQEIASHERDYPLETSDNFYFDKKGITFQYGSGVLGSSIIGRPTLSIPYSQLKGIVKAEYLP